jgi:hypothetical protein
MEGTRLESIRLPLETHRVEDGVVLIFDSRELRVQYDWHGDDGTARWAEIGFTGVIAFEHAEWPIRRPSTLGWRSVVFVFAESAWRDQRMTAWNAAVGQYVSAEMRERFGDARFKHFMIYFEDQSTLDILAESFNGSRPTLER